MSRCLNRVVKIVKDVARQLKKFAFAEVGQLITRYEVENHEGIQTNVDTESDRLARRADPAIVYLRPTSRLPAVDS